MNKSNYIIAISAMMISGCAKDGATGPQGPAGKNGVANITTSPFTAIPGAWSNPSSGYYDFSVADPDITNANTDFVSAFVQINSGGDWIAIPVSTRIKDTPPPYAPLTMPPLRLG